ncbi:MAG: hypothetical protein CMB63_07060 [Euryarchaeota archaeon]|nr:hypothetical protein [Euryarchaeota archaeon]
MRVALLLVSLMLVLMVPVSGEEEAFVMAQSIQDGKLKVTAIENPNSSFEFVQNGPSWELDLSTLPDGKHTIGLSSDGEEQLAVFWTGAQSEFIWEDALIQMVMIDRFVNGNTSNDGLTSGSSFETDWQGGDLQGVTQMIESGYFENLGINAIWLSPLNTNPNGSFIAMDGVHRVSGYHGYWPVEPRQVNPRFGGEVALDELVRVAHSRGMRVIADFTINHVHEDHVYFKEHPEWFNDGCLCGTSGCDWTERRLDCLFMSYMPDIDWNNEEARDQMVSDALWWIERFDLDGLRIDAVKHVDDSAITALSTAINERFERTGNDVYLKGETAMGWSGHSLGDNQEQYATINQYISEDGLDGQADFVLYHAVVDNVFSKQHMDYRHLDYWTNRSQDQYVQGAVMTPYIGSHDTPRIISRIENDGTQWNQWSDQETPGVPPDWAYARLKQSIGWLLTTPGAPVIYMGDEFGMHGGADPDNRRMLNFSLTSEQQDLHDFTALLGQFRLENEALRRGVYSTYYADADILAYEMISEGQELLVVLNRGGSTTLDVDYGEVLLGHADLTEGILSIPASSISIIGYEDPPNENLTVEEESDELISGEGVGDVEESDLLNSRALQNGLIILVFIMLALLIRTIREVR